MTTTATAGQRCAKLRMLDDPARKDIIGILIDPVDYQSAADRIMAAARERRGFAVSALAVHGIMTGALDKTHKYRLNRFDLIVPDGQPVRWALNLKHNAGLADRVYGPKLTLEVLARAERENVAVYFYGSTHQTLTRLQCEVKRRFPAIEIAGAQPSRFCTVTPDVADAIATEIKMSGAGIVFAGLGCPRQEVWAFEFRDRLGMPILAVGAAFPFIAGTLRQAPAWMQARGLEWLFRLIEEPRRLWKRYVFLNPIYVALLGFQLAGYRFDLSGRPPSREMLYA
jgi:N-acetylglucosaminyldiphosphoundecaprenol N-acetyl-beta-D-mannosaminyltransferase